MKRHVLFVIGLLCCITLFTPQVFAVTSVDYPFDQTDCGQKGQPTCKVNRDILHEVIIDPQSKKTWEETKDKETGEIFITLIHSLTFDWGDGSFKPVGEYKIPEFINRYGAWLKRTIPFLDPGSLQKVTVDNTNDQMISTCARRCVYDHDGNLIDNEECKDTIKTLPIPGIPQLFQGSATFTSYFSPVAKKKDQIYQKPSLEVKKATVYGCPVRRSGQDIEPTGHKAIDINLFNFFQHIENTYQAAVGVVIGEKQVRNPSTVCPNCGEIAAQLSQVKPELLTDADLPADYKAKLVKQGGFVDADISSAMKVKSGDPNGVIVNTFEESNGKTFDLPTRSYNTMYMKQTLDHQCNAVLPGDLHAKFCTPPAEAPTTTTTPDTDQDVCKVADQYGIPCCMLQGIMAQESKTGQDMGTAKCGGFSCCNGTSGTSACGPAQILCGQYGEWAGNDHPNMCTEGGAAVLLARAMRLKVCQAHGGCAAYNWAANEKEAMSYPLFDDKFDPNNDDQYAAAGYFYGMAHGCVADGCSQYRWGAGKSYCTPIIEYCKAKTSSPNTEPPPYPDNKSMEFCQACSDEYEKAKLPPLTCN